MRSIVEYLLGVTPNECASPSGLCQGCNLSSSPSTAGAAGLSPRSIPSPASASGPGPGSGSSLGRATCQSSSPSPASASWSRSSSRRYSQYCSALTWYVLLPACARQSSAKTTN